MPRAGSYTRAFILLKAATRTSAWIAKILQYTCPLSVMIFADMSPNFDLRLNLNRFLSLNYKSTSNKEKDIVGAFSGHFESSRRFVDRCGAGGGWRVCHLLGVLLAAVSLLSSSVGPQPPPRQHGDRGRGQHGPCLLQEVGTTYILPEYQNNQ